MDDCKRNQYEDFCKEQFEHLKTKMDRLTQRLYIDNGSESLQSKMNRIERWISLATRIGIAISITVGGLCVDAIQNFIAKLIAGMGS